jgi:ketosteroid isomerase-like protein
MDRQQVTAWITAYEQAWRTAGTDALAALFTPDAVYRQGPWEPDVVGLASIGAMWERERSGPDEIFTMASEVVAVEADTAVVRVEVRYGDPLTQEWRDLWVIRYSDDGRCHEFEEWPIAPYS